METVSMPKKEYEELKKKAEVDMALVGKIKRGLEDPEESVNGYEVSGCCMGRP